MRLPEVAFPSRAGQCERNGRRVVPGGQYSGCPLLSLCGFQAQAQGGAVITRSCLLWFAKEDLGWFVEFQSRRLNLCKNPEP